MQDKYRLKNHRVVVFPGDYEFSNAAAQVAEAAPAILQCADDVVVVFACRAKTERSRDQKRIVMQRLASFGERVRFLDEINDMPRFIGLADVLVLPQNNLYAKMDIPLVLLEAMAHQVPLLLANAGPLQELISQDAAIGVDDASALAASTVRLLQSPGETMHLGQTGHALVKSTYNAFTMAKSVESLYDELLEG